MKHDAICDCGSKATAQDKSLRMSRNLKAKRGRHLDILEDLTLFAAFFMAVSMMAVSTVMVVSA